MVVENINSSIYSIVEIVNILRVSQQENFIQNVVNSNGKYNGKCSQYLCMAATAKQKTCTNLYASAVKERYIVYEIKVSEIASNIE